MIFSCKFHHHHHHHHHHHQRISSRQVLKKTSGPLCVTCCTSVNATVAGGVRCRMIYEAIKITGTFANSQARKDVCTAIARLFLWNKLRHCFGQFCCRIIGRLEAVTKPGRQTFPTCLHGKNWEITVNPRKWCIIILQSTYWTEVTWLDSSHVHVNVLGHTPTPFLSVENCHLCLFPGESHSSQIFLDYTSPVCPWPTGPPLETWDLPV